MYQIKVHIELIQFLHKDQLLGVLGKLIDTALCSSPVTRPFHKENQFKYYVFNLLTPLEPTGIYAPQTPYQFTIRTIHPVVYGGLLMALNRLSTPALKVKEVTTNEITIKGTITHLTTQTPVILTLGSGYWSDASNPITDNYPSGQHWQSYQSRLVTNLYTRFNQFYHTQVSEAFPIFESCSRLNHKPCAVPYKGIKLLGDKLTVTVADNPIAQDLAHLAIGCGLGEKTSRGFGFVTYKVGGYL